MWRSDLRPWGPRVEDLGVAQGFGARGVRSLELLSTVDDRNPALPLRVLNYGNYGTFLINLLFMGNAGCIPSAVSTPDKGIQTWLDACNTIYLCTKHAHGNYSFMG